MNDDLCILVGGYPLIGAKKRGGKFVTKVIPDVTMKTLRGVALDTIKIKARPFRPMNYIATVYWPVRATSTGR